MGSLSSENLFIFKPANLTARRHHRHPACLYTLFDIFQLPLKTIQLPDLSHFVQNRYFSSFLWATLRKKNLRRVSNCLVEIRGLDTVILCPHSPSPHSLPLSSPAGIHTWVMGLPQQVARWWSEGRRKKGGVWGCAWCWSTRERGRWGLRWGKRPPGEPGESEAHVDTDPHWVMAVQGYLFDRERKANTFFVKLPWKWGVMQEQHFLLLQQIKYEIKLK